MSKRPAHTSRRPVEIPRLAFPEPLFVAEEISSVDKEEISAARGASVKRRGTSSPENMPRAASMPLPRDTARMTSVERFLATPRMTDTCQYIHSYPAERWLFVTASAHTTEATLFSSVGGRFEPECEQSSVRTLNVMFSFGDEFLQEAERHKINLVRYISSSVCRLLWMCRNRYTSVDTVRFVLNRPSGVISTGIPGVQFPPFKRVEFTTIPGWDRACYPAITIQGGVFAKEVGVYNSKLLLRFPTEPTRDSVPVIPRIDVGKDGEAFVTETSSVSVRKRGFQFGTLLFADPLDKIVHSPWAVALCKHAKYIVVTAPSGLHYSLVTDLSALLSGRHDLVKSARALNNDEGRGNIVQSRRSKTSMCSHVYKVDQEMLGSVIQKMDTRGKLFYRQEEPTQHASLVLRQIHSINKFLQRDPSAATSASFAERSRRAAGWDGVMCS